ncbi:MAG: hypothetical protein U9Q07_11260, partial [Planctomycetota bacterium]|nr:hypothetical protein [Planctomycetota bacterium]
MKKIYLFILILSSTVSLAYAETLTLTTYYPAPFGNYDRLRLAPLAAAPACDASLEGLLYYDDTADNIFVCADGGVWESITG